MLNTLHIRAFLEQHIPNVTVTELKITGLNYAGELYIVVNDMAKPIPWTRRLSQIHKTDLEIEAELNEIIATWQLEAEMIDTQVARLQRIRPHTSQPLSPVPKGRKKP